jgi:hypothetical protein
MTAVETRAAELATWDTTTVRARRPARSAALSRRREVVVSGDMSCMMIRSQGSVNDPMNVAREANVGSPSTPPVERHFPQAAQRFPPRPIPGRNEPCVGVAACPALRLE